MKNKEKIERGTRSVARGEENTIDRPQVVMYGHKVVMRCYSAFLHVPRSDFRVHKNEVA